MLKKILPLTLLIVAVPVGYYASRCGVTPECPLAYQLHEYSFSIFKPLWVFSLYSIAGVLFLPFVKERVFKIWFRFTKVWVVATILLVVWAPETMNSWFPLISHTKSDVAYWMGAAFSFISICIILITSLIPYQKPSKGA